MLPAPQPAAIGELAEGFDDITQLPGAGWALINNSEPLGPTSWFQGNPTIFPAHEGDPDAYIAANFESTDAVGTISNWLITPEVTIVNGTTITFWTRKAELFGEFADRLEVRMSVAGASTDVGDTAESVGDFTEVLLTINPDLIPGEYPQEWTQFTLTVRGRSREPVTGRFAFRYWVTDAGPNGTNADYIGIDTVSVTQPGESPPGGCDDPVDIPWLSADPVGGTTAPGASEPVTVAVDPGDLEVGEYTAQLCVTTNDPNAELVTVPVSLTVTGGTPGPVADISPGAFEFEIPAGGSAGDVLDVGNVGTADLVWSVDEAEDGVALEVPAGGGGRAASAGTTTPAGLDPATMPRVPTSTLLASRLDPGLVRGAMGHRFRRRLPAPRLTSATPGGAAGGTANWSSLGPPGGDVADVAVSTVDPQIVLAGVVPLPFYSGGTLYRSSDGGVTWTEVSALAGISVYAIEFTPAGDVYIATHDGVWESTDGGLTWIRHEIEISLNPQVLALAIDPSDPATLWAGVVTHPNQPLSLVRSLDGGETWEDRTPPLTQPLHGEAVAVAPNDSNIVIATFNGDFDTGEIWVSTDAGATWTNRSAGLPGNPLYDLVYDGSRLLVGGGLWFLDQQVGLYESTDLGITWTPLHDSTWPSLLVEDVAVDPNDAATLLVATYGGGVHRSTDGGTTWEIGVGGSGGALAHSLRFQPGSSEVLFVGTSPQGVLRSLDGGDQFSASADGVSELDFASIDANPLAPTELAIAYQGQNYGGVLSSVDGGTTWQPEPLPSAGSTVARFAPDGTLYAVATGPSGASQGLYRRESDGSWTWLGPDPGGQSGSLFLAVRFSVNDPGLILLGGMDVGSNDFEATIWRSGDGGQSWTKVYEAAPDSGAWVIDIDIVEDGSDQVMLATFTERFGNQGGALRSADGGLTWLPSTTGLPAGELGEPELCASVADPQVFYLSLSPSFLQNQLFRTLDGGLNWEPTGWLGGGRSGAVACDRVDPQVLYLGLLDVPADGGNHGQVWRSVDGGVTFEPFTDGLPGGAAPRALAFAGTSRLLLASDKGTWATDLGGGGGGCADPADVPWLSVAPASGVTPPGDSVPVDVLVDTAGLDAGEYAARLCVTTNDPAAPLVEIPVNLTVTADSWQQEAKLTTSDGTVGDLFALAVAVDGDTALIGAPLTTVGENVAQGAVHVFVREGTSWVEQATLVAADGAAFDTLGFSVALAGDTALVAATGVNASQGAVYVFTREGTAWSEQAKLTAADGVPSDFFGSSVAISGDSALVGAPNVSLDGTTQQGAAYVFVRDGGNWTEQARIVAADGADGDSYGARVGLSGDTALINASFADIGDNPDQGAAYVYTRDGDTWSEQAKLAAADGAANDNFAITVALDGDTALMGAWTATVEGDEVRGAAYVFARDGGSWSEQAKLVASDGAAGDSFGVAVALSGDAAVVGAHGADPEGHENEGAAYVFARNGATWSEQAKLVIDDGVGNEGVGGAVALSGGTAVVGAPIASPGAAYVFSHGALQP